MESDLISRSALRRSLEMHNMTELYPEWRTLSLGMKEKIGRLAGAFLKAINSAPDVDAVSVVRCRECKHYDSGHWCDELERGTAKDYFCAYGQKKEITNA